METLVVLAALVCAAIAAPALQQQGLQEFQPTQDFTQREKKSPARNNAFTDFSNADTSSHTFDADTFPESARSLHFKKPLIVKKKVGYHLYRNSDEEKEQSTSRETCKERVKVKLCDENNIPKSNLMRSTTVEDVGEHVMTEDEMKHSIKMAKEVIANLERDLKKIEQNPGPKINQRKHDDIDAQIHEDIDTARQVLEHIHKNFGDLESMTIHTTTSKDADSLHNVHLTVAKTEQERMAQWKEAMKNIQKNAEIARNIEDSFKFTGPDLSLNDFQMAENHETDETSDNHKVIDEMRRDTIGRELINTDLDKPKQCDSKLHDAKMAQNQAEDKEHSIDDMNGSASTIMESSMKANSGNNLRNNEQDTTVDEKSTTNTMIGTMNNQHFLQQSRNSDEATKPDATDPEQSQTVFMKETENGPEKDLNIENIETISTNEDIMNTNQDSLMINMKSTELDKAKNAADCMEKNNHKHLHHNHNTNESEDTNTLIKSATDSNTSESVNMHTNDKSENNLQNEQPKSVDTTGNPVLNQFTHQTRNTDIDAVTSETQNREHAISNPSHSTEGNNFQGKTTQNDHMMSKSELSNKDQEEFSTNLKPMHIEGMKSADHDNVPSQPSNHAFHMRRPSDQMQNNRHEFLDTGSHGFSTDFSSRAPSMNTHFMNGPQMMPSMNSVSNFDPPSSHAHVHTSHINRMHGHMTHGKSPDVDNIAQPNFNLNMREAMGNFGPENNMIRWKPTHDSARTAYGAMAPAAAPGGGQSAVGLFPNANVGGCSIPLLLSCSPSVTSGSLAKAIPAGYGSSAYRTEDEFTFFPNKREIKKAKEIVDTTVIKTPTNTRQKTTMDTKQ